MKIDQFEFMKIYMAIMSENEISCIRVNDFLQVIKMIYSSKEYKELVEKLDLDSFLDTDFYKLEYTKGIDENGMWTFDIPKDDVEKIFEKYDHDSDIVTKVINKYAFAKYIEMQTEGKIKVGYEEPDGEYTLYLVTEPFNNCETKLFTDGKIKEGEVKYDTGIYTKYREPYVEESTFSILVDYQNDKPLSAEIRTNSSADYYMVYSEAINLMNGLDFSYDEKVKEKPRIYKFKVN